MNLKENTGEYMGRLGSKKGKWEIIYYLKK